MSRPSHTFHATKPTCVTFFYDKYIKFSESSSITIQALCNRSLHLYQTDSKFKRLIDNTNDLKVSGSGF